MGKIHIGERIYRGERPNRTGEVIAYYHVNIEAVRNTTLDVSEAVEVDGQDLVDGVVRSVLLRLGISDVVPLLSTHPDFGATVEATLLSEQRIAEVEVTVGFTESESLATIAARVDSLYDTIESQIRTLYTEHFQHYGVVRNPA